MHAQFLTRKQKVRNMRRKSSHGQQQCSFYLCLLPQVYTHLSTHPPTHSLSHSPTHTHKIHLSLLIANYLFRDLSDVKRTAIADMMRPVLVKQGDMVVKQGEEGDCFSVVEKGT